MTGSAENGGGQRAIPWRAVGWAAGAAALALPLVATAFVDGMAWTAFDFGLVAALVACIGLGLELAVRKSREPAYRAAAALALAAAVFLILITGAVGVIGSDSEPANLLFAGVLAVALIGAIVARFRPAGMAAAMVAAAVAQAAVPPIASILHPAARTAIWAPEVFALTGGYVAVWLAAAWLFGKAAQRPQA